MNTIKESTTPGCGVQKAKALFEQKVDKEKNIDTSSKMSKDKNEVTQNAKPITNGTVETNVNGVENCDQVEETIVRMRGRGASLDNGSAITALQRGMNVLHETDNEKEMEELRQLDSQLDHLNNYMEKIETKLHDHHRKLSEQLEKQRTEREQRRKSLMLRKEQSQAEDDDFHNQVMAMLNRCRQSSIINDENVVSSTTN